MTLFTPENTEACKAIATWEPFSNSILYRLRLQPDTKMTEQLGMINLRADGRWNWRRLHSGYHKGWTTGQGVALTKKEAKAKVMEGWTCEE